MKMSRSLISSLIIIFCFSMIFTLQLRNRNNNENNKTNEQEFTAPKNQNGPWKIEAQTGQITLKIEGNRTTGNMWRLKNHQNFDTTILKGNNVDKYGEADYLETPTEAGVSGGPGFEIFRFTGLKAGKVNLQFGYGHFKQEPVNTLNVEITIK
jgi:predicted secreted protein